MKFTVDRIEDGFAVLEKEDMTHITVKAEALPRDIKEGSVLFFDGSSYMHDPDAEAQTRKRIISKQKSIFNKR